MSEQVYSIGERVNISFSESDNTWRCLCGFPYNCASDGEVDKSIVASLALLGAAVVLAHQEEIDGYAYLPYCVPEWIREAIRRVTRVDNG